MKTGGPRWYEVKSWTPLLPQTHQIYGYIWNNYSWKTPKIYLNSSFTWNNKGATSRQVGEAETGSHHKPHPCRDPQSEGNKQIIGVSPWRAKGLFSTLSNPILKTCIWAMSPQNFWLWKPTGLTPTKPKGLLYTWN